MVADVVVVFHFAFQHDAARLEAAVGVIREPRRRLTGGQLQLILLCSAEFQQSFTTDSALLHVQHRCHLTHPKYAKQQCHVSRSSRRNTVWDTQASCAHQHEERVEVAQRGSTNGAADAHTCAFHLFLTLHHLQCVVMRSWLSSHQLGRTDHKPAIA